MLLETWTGAETSSQGAARLYMLWVPTRDHKGTETHISKAIQTPALGISRLNQQAHPAAVDGKLDEYGTWYQATYNVPEGLVFALYGSRTTPAHGQRNPNGAVLLQARDGAAQRRIVFRGSGASVMRRQDYTIMGRFDLLTLEEAEELGVVIHPMQKAKFLDSNRDRVFSFEELAAEITRRPVRTFVSTTNIQGETVRVEIQQRRRAIRID